MSNPQTENDTNCTMKSILILPPEIRNKIYAITLTNYHIHIRRLSQLERQKKSIQDGGFYHQVLPFNDPPPPPNPSTIDVAFGGRVTDASPKRIPQLWLTCKQIYQETIALPFSSANVFSFEDGLVFEEFLQQAPHQQIKGIRRLWIPNKTHSEVAMSCTTLEQNLTTVYVRSRIQKLKTAADSEASRLDMNWLRTGWDLAAERMSVQQLAECWESLVDVHIREV